MLQLIFHIYCVCEWQPLIVEKNVCKHIMLIQKNLRGVTKQQYKFTVYSLLSNHFISVRLIIHNINLQIVNC